MRAGTPKRGGSSKIGRGFMTPINFSANSAPQLILKILLVVSIVHLISYTMLQKMLTPKPTPHLTLTLTSEIGAERKLQFRR